MTDPNRRIRILLIEDEEMNRALLRAILARAVDGRLRSAETLEAGTRKDARKLLSDAGLAIDICLLDVQLADGSGLDLIGELVARSPRPRVVVMTAGVLTAQREAAEKAGCDAFVSKPYMPAELLDTLTALLPHRSPQAGLR